MSFYEARKHGLERWPSVVRKILSKNNTRIGPEGFFEPSSVPEFAKVSFFGSP